MSNAEPTGPARLPPTAQDAERIVLATLLTAGGMRTHHAGYLREDVLPEHFADPANGQIFRLLLAGHDPSELPALMQEQLQDVGGAAYLRELAAKPTDLMSGIRAAERVRDAAARRELIGVADVLRALAAEVSNAAFDTEAGLPAAEQASGLAGRLRATLRQVDELIPE